MSRKTIKIIYTGLLAGFISQAFLGAVFMSPFVQNILYDPDWQSELFLEVTPMRDLFSSVSGIVILSAGHGWLFTVFKNSIPGQTWIGKGLFWGFTIWFMYWVFQEWFVYHTLLREPILLTLFELAILLPGSVIEGLIISKYLYEDQR
jgi:hypothetical protein